MGDAVATSGAECGDGPGKTSWPEHEGVVCILQDDVRGDVGGGL
jgi:hypothetical protein